MRINTQRLGTKPVSWLRLILSVIMFIGLSFATSMVLVVFSAAFAEIFFGLRLRDMADSSPYMLALTFGSLAVLHIPLAITIRVVFGRKYLSLANPFGRSSAREVRIALLAWLLMGLVGFIVAEIFMSNIFETRYVWDIPTWLVWFIPIAILAFLQSSAEELVFRGFLQQYLAKLTGRRIIYILVPNLLWTALHIGNFEDPLLVCSAIIHIFIFGLIWGDWADRTNNLTAPIVLHFVNNLLLTIGYGTDIEASDLLIFTDHIDPENYPQFAIFVVVSAIAWGLFYLFFIRPKLTRHIPNE